MTTYELWLDESGDFKNEREKQGRDLKASLIGGILILENKSDEVLFDDIIDETRIHAMELTDQDKREYVLPALERLNEWYDAKEVFFENTGYQDSSTHRQLYLKIMAEGLLQLMLRLNATEESVCLRVYIARRQDVDANPEHKVIQEKEYLRELGRCIERKKREHKLVLHEDSRMSFEVSPAGQSVKLQLADFACNTRLTRDSRAFCNVRERVEKLYENGYIFSMMEMTSEDYILMSLAQGCLSDALLELYTTRDNINRESCLDIFFQKIQKWNYRFVKTQWKQASAELFTLVVLEDDYEVGEEILKNINKEVVPRLNTLEGDFGEFSLSVLLNLAEMYLKEGDVLSARDALAEYGQVHSKMSRKLENISYYFRYMEKLALYNINSFQFQVAVEIMERISETVRGLIRVVQEEAHLFEWFSGCRSERLGDMLCMRIYAMMFVQRQNPESYPLLCELADEAVKQYSNQEGELERIRQYRSHIEMEQGNYENALQYLISAKNFHMPEITGTVIADFLNRIAATEPEISCRYYLMYYIEIMARAKQGGEALANEMADALEQQTRMKRILQLDSVDYDLENKVELKAVKKHSTGILYHPMEIIYWKYGVYIYHCHIKRGFRTAKQYMEKAIQLCRAYQEYLTMQICSLGIEAELVAMCQENGAQQKAEEHLAALLEHLTEIGRMDLDMGTRGFLKKIEEKLKKGDFLGIAELIAY